MHYKFYLPALLCSCGIFMTQLSPMGLLSAADALPPVPQIADKGNKLVKNYLEVEFADTWIMVPWLPGRKLF